MGVIYKTTNLKNGKWYIGKDSKNDPNYLGSGLLLNRAIRKYGENNFEKVILEETNDLNNREKYWIEQTNACSDPNSYNIAEGGQGGNTIKGLLELEKQSHSEKTKERWKNYSKEERKIISEKISTKNKGKPKSEDHKRKLSNAAKKRLAENPHPWKGKSWEELFDEETVQYMKQNLSKKCGKSGNENGFYGKSHSHETKKRISEKKKGIPSNKSFFKNREELENLLSEKTVSQIANEYNISRSLIYRSKKRFGIH